MLMAMGPKEIEAFPSIVCGVELGLGREQASLGFAVGMSAFMAD